MKRALIALVGCLVAAGCVSTEPVGPIDITTPSLVPEFDTLVVDERTSYPLPDTSMRSMDLKLFVHTIEMKVELAYNGRMYVSAPLEPVQGGVRLYHKDTLVPFGLKHVRVTGAGRTSPALTYNIWPTTGYSGTPVMVRGIGNPSETAKLKAFINDTEVPIDSGRSPLFIRYAYDSAARIVVLADSMAYGAGEFTIAEYQPFLDRKPIERISITGFTLLGATTIFYQTDTGIVASPQASIPSINLMSQKIVQNTSEWRGDSLIAQFRETSSQQEDVIDLQLYQHPGRDEVSGTLSLTVRKQNQDTRVTMQLNRIGFTRTGTAYRLYCKEELIKHFVPVVDYYLDAVNAREVTDEYHGGTKSSFIRIDISARP